MKPVLDNTLDPGAFIQVISTQLLHTAPYINLLCMCCGLNFFWLRIYQVSLIFIFV